MVVILLPVSFVARAVSIGKESFSVCLAIFPESFINRGVGVNHSASAIRLITDPVSLENGAILSNLHSTTKSRTVIPLTFVLTTVWQFCRILLRSKLIIFTWQFAILELRHSSTFVKNFLSQLLALFLGQCFYATMHHAWFASESVRFFDTVANKEAASYGLELNDCYNRHINFFTSITFHRKSYISRMFNPIDTAHLVTHLVLKYL